VARSHRYTAFERLALITKVRPGEGRAVALFGAHVFLILFSDYLFRAAREGLLLAKLSAADASYATAITATLLMFIVAPTQSRVGVVGEYGGPGMNFSLARVCPLVGFVLLASVSMTVGAQTARPASPGRMRPCDPDADPEQCGR